MKTQKKGLLILLVFSLVFPVTIFSQAKEVPFTTSSKEASSLFLDGLQKFENVEFFAASQLFDQVIKADPGFAMAYYYRALSGGGYNVFQENLDKALSLADKVSEGEKYQILFLKAQSEGNFAKMKESADWLLSNFKYDKRIQMLAGNYYGSMNDPENAIVHYTLAIQLDKNYAGAYNSIGYAQSALNNFPAAEKAFQEYIRLIPDKANPYDSYGELLLKMGRYDESIAQYKKAVGIDPANFTMSLGGLGNNYVFKGDFITARKYYKEYFEKSPQIGGKLTALNFIANSYLYEGKTDSALNTFEEYRKFVEKENSRINLVNYYTNVGYMLDETGKPAAATGYYDKIDELSKELKIPVEIQESIKVNSMISHLNNLIALKELDKAKPELDKCIKDIETRNNPTEKMGINMISGYYAVQKGSWDDALGYLSKADNQNPRTWYYTGVAYKNKGDIPNAKKCFTKVAEYNVNSLDLALLRNRAKMELK